MRTKTGLAISAALAMVAVGSAFGQTTTSIDPGSVTDSNTAGSTTGGVGATGTVDVAKFNDPSKVLVGATFATQMATGTINFTSSSNNPSTGELSGTATFNLGSGSTLVSGSGTSGPLSVGGVKSSASKQGGLGAYTANASATTQGQLDNLFGSGTVSATIGESYTLQWTGGAGTNITADNAGTRSATVTPTYSSVNHANGSFNSGVTNNNSLPLSFGNILAGSTPTGLAFNLYNLVSSFGLQVVSANYSGSGLFSLSGITGTSDLAAGSFASGVVNMASTLAAGDYSGLWTFTVADSASGIGAGRNFSGTDTLTLAVNAHVAAVPEPGEWAMMLAGFGLIGFIANRKRRRNG
jgi:hypothetical protein